MLQSILYSVWQERNAKLFGESKRSEDEISQMIVETVKMKLMTLKVKDTLAVKKVERSWNIVLIRI